MRGFKSKSSIAATLPLVLAAGAAAHPAQLTNGTPPAPPAATVPVNNCNDGGAGSLRAAIAAAGSGDTIDLRALECRRIVLTSGSIGITQDSLTLLGPTRAFLIDGNRRYPVFEHSGTGTLRLRAMSIAYGYHAGRSVTGGCIDSDGDVRLEYVRVHDCFADEIDGFFGSGGGGIAARDVAAYDSEVFNNTAWPVDRLEFPVGGGIWARGHLTLVRSRISGNFARAGDGGGAYAEGGTHVRYSEISGNTARHFGTLYAEGGAMVVEHSLVAGNEGVAVGIVGLYAIPDPHPALVMNTTISGNRAYRNSALIVGTQDASVVNSTIVLNTETNFCDGALRFGEQLHLESTIVARNHCRGVPGDVNGQGGVIGSDNLVLASTVPLPPDTISANPRISPLADNGGRTRTHALWAGSPAVDMGNNNAGLAYDQRGPRFARVRGGRADIGAYER